MKILLFIICFFTLWTSTSNAVETNNLNLIVDSKLINTSFSTIKHENFIMVPLQNFLDILNIEYTIETYNEEKININFSNNMIELYPNSYKACINGQNVDLIVPSIVQDNKIYVSVNLIDDLSKFYIYYDKHSNSIFATSKSDFNKLEFFFNKVEKILNNFNNITIDIITEIISTDDSSYSTGSNILINRTLNKIFTKNMLDTNWQESNIKISTNISANFNTTFFAGMSVDRINSNNNYIIFNGYYPLDNNRICYSKLYVNPHTLQIEKQINEFDFEGSTVKQTVFYSYN